MGVEQRVLRAKEAVDLDEGDLINRVEVDRMDLRRDKAGLGHVRDCFVKLPVALVQLNNRELDQHPLEMWQGPPAAVQHALFESLGVDLKQDIAGYDRQHVV